MRSKQIDIDPANVDPDGLADLNSSAGASVTLDGALTSGGTFTSADGLAHRLDIIDTGTDDQRGATYTITGTDADGHAQVENILGPNSTATIETLKYFLTVTSITIASPVADSTVDIGTVDEISTKTYVVDHYINTAPSIGMEVTGTISMDVQLSTRNAMEINHKGEIPEALRMVDQEDMNWVNDDNLAAVGASAHGQISDYPIKAIRFVSVSYTDTAEVQVEITQSTY